MMVQCHKKGDKILTREDFFKKVNAMIPPNSEILHSVTLAQALFESCDSKGNVANSSLTRIGNALFGIKATKNWTGKVMNCHTYEIYKNNERWEGGLPFRAYNNWQESIIDHERFLCVENRNRYIKVINEKDYKKACQALSLAGYATEPTYSEKLIWAIERYKLYQYDKPQIPSSYIITFFCGTETECKTIQNTIYQKVGKYNGTINKLNNPIGSPQFSITFRTDKDFECKTIQNVVYQNVGKYNGKIETK